LFGEGNSQLWHIAVTNSSHEQMYMVFQLVMAQDVALQGKEPYVICRMIINIPRWAKSPKKQSEGVHFC